MGFTFGRPRSFVEIRPFLRGVQFSELRFWEFLDQKTAETKHSGFFGRMCVFFAQFFFCGVGKWTRKIFNFRHVAPGFSWVNQPFIWEMVG